MPRSCAACSAPAIWIADAHRLVRRQRPADRLALEVFEHQVVRADVVHLADVRVVERGDRVRLALEALEVLGGHLFDGDDAVEARVAGSIDFAHAAGADDGFDFVGAEARSRGEGHDLRIIVPRR